MSARASGPDPAASRLSRVRAGNLALVLARLAEEAPLSRARLAARTGLTKSSVSGLVSQLLDGGLVVEDGPQRAGDRGRPGTALRVDPRGAAGLGLEVNVDYLAAVVLDLAGTPRYHHVVARDNRGGTPSAVREALARLARAACSAAGSQGLRPAGVCLAVPGLVDHGTVARAPNLGWSGVPLEAVLPESLSGVPLGARLENEANLAALGELWWGEPALGDFVHVSGEVGIGAGIVVGGDLFGGSGSRAGEFGHLVADPEGPRCSCGGRGCLERVAGQEAILAAAGTASLEELVRGCEAGRRRCRQAVDAAGRRLGVAAASVAALLDPDTVVLGGAFAALAPWLLPPLEETLRRHACDDDPARPRVVVSRLGRDAAVRGAAGRVVRDVLHDPARFLALAG